MNAKRQILPGLAVADQPTEADLDELKRDGYAGVVNLRNRSPLLATPGPASIRHRRCCSTNGLTLAAASCA